MSNVFELADNITDCNKNCNIVPSKIITTLNFIGFSKQFAVNDKTESLFRKQKFLFPQRKYFNYIVVLRIIKKPVEFI